MRTALPRHDLDGLRLIEPDKPDVWLVFRGERHRIVSPDVYAALFADGTDLTTYEGVEWIALGHEIGEGACLIRADGSLSIHLLTRDERGQVQKHFVPTYESLLDFGFDESKVRSVSPLVVEGLADGAELRSAADRAARR